MRDFIKIITRQRWLRFGIRDRIARWWHNPDTAKPEAFDVPFFGYRYRGNFSTFLDWSVFYFGAYSEGELLLMRELLKNVEKPIIFDVGANVGHHTLFAASIADTVHSFEPYDLVAAQLLDKVSYNGIKNVTLHRFGLGNENRQLRFEAPTNCNTGTGKFVLDSASNDGASGGRGGAELEVRRGDDVVEELALNALDFIKIDVEGLEVEVLKGLRETLERFRPTVFFEWNQSESGEAVFQPLLPPNYEFFSFESTPPLLGVFCSGPYRLRKLTDMENKKGATIGGNYLALPIEKDQIAVWLVPKLHTLDGDLQSRH